MSGRETFSSDSTSEVILGGLLKIFSLYPSNGKGSFLRTVSASIMISASVVAFLYEMVGNINVLEDVFSSTSGATITNIVYQLKYCIKTAVSVVVLIIFCKKSRGIARIIHQLDHFYQRARGSGGKNGGQYSRLAFSSLLVFVSYLAVTTFTRVLHIIEEPWKIRRFYPWLQINILEDECIALLIRNFPEAIRLVSSGFLGVLLVKFAEGPAAECLRILGKTAVSHKKLIFLRSFRKTQKLNFENVKL
jgi:hypothetical protein